MIFAKSKLVS